MGIKIHLPNDDEFNIHQGADSRRCKPEINKNFCICYDVRYYDKNSGWFLCKHCCRCLNAIVVEKTEDNKEIWIEFEGAKNG